jgi:hypothetical protein
MIDRMKFINKKMEYMDKFNKAFRYPFSFINTENNKERYGIKNIINIMFNKNMKQEKMNINKFNFPRNIIDVLWFDEGSVNKKEWQFIGIIKYKNKKKFIYYVAISGYTGFTYQGEMKLYVSRSLGRLFRKAIPQNLINSHKEIQEIQNKLNKN